MPDVWTYCVASSAEVVTAVRARLEQGPFVEVADPAHAYRTIEIEDTTVRERGADLDDTLLPAHLAAATREPVIANMSGWTTRWLPDGTTETAADVSPPAAWRPATVLHVALDPTKQRSEERSFESELPRFVEATLFPIRTRLARLDCKQARLYDSPALGYRYLSAEIWLAIYAATADGNDRELVDLRKETVAVCNLRGLRRDRPLDEYAAAYFAGLRRWKRGLTERLAATTSWTGITPATLLDG